MRSSYRAALDELIYAYVTYRLHIEYANSALSNLSSNPAKCHYHAIKRVFRYFWETKYFGLVYRHPCSKEDLPVIDHPRRPQENDEEFKFPFPSNIDQLGGCVDAAPLVA